MEKKIIELDSEMERNLTAVCDAALKHSGMQIYGTINQMILSIKSKEKIEV